MKKLGLSILLALSGSAFADQAVVIQGAVVNTVGGIVDQKSPCSPALAVTGIDQETQNLLQLCTTAEALSKTAFSNGATAAETMQGSTFFFKGSIIGKGEVLSIDEVSGVNDANPQQNCTGDATKDLAKKLGVAQSAIKFFNAALVGDGADAIEIDMFQVAKKPGLYKVELDGEMCDLRNIEYVNN